MENSLKDDWLVLLHYSIRRYLVDHYHFEHTVKIPRGSRVLDVGGHKEGGRGQFRVQLQDWDVVCLNIEESKGVDIVASAEEMPLENHSFDHVICSEVMEHVLHPRKVLSECFRVLNKGGKIYATVPFLYREHADPHDYGRYTEYFWRESLRDVGFSEVEIVRQGDFHMVLVDMLKQFLNSRTWPLWQKKFFKRFLYIYQDWAVRNYFINKKDEAFNRSFTTGFGILAKK